MGAFGLVGSPLEKERELQRYNLNPHQRFWEFQKGQFPFGKGFGGKAPEDRGGWKSFRDLCGIFQSRGKAHEKGRSFLFRSPLNGFLDSECCLQVCFLLHTFFNLGISPFSLNYPIPFHPLKKRGFLVVFQEAPLMNHPQGYFLSCLVMLYFDSVAPGLKRPTKKTKTLS